MEYQDIKQTVKITYKSLASCITELLQMESVGRAMAWYAEKKYKKMGGEFVPVIDEPWTASDAWDIWVRAGSECIRRQRLTLK